jgi:hypothetical protein
MRRRDDKDWVRKRVFRDGMDKWWKGIVDQGKRHLNGVDQPKGGHRGDQSVPAQ